MTEAQLEARDDAALAKPDPEIIWLTPNCSALEIEGRAWCEEHPGDCHDDGCGLKAIKYIRADLAANEIESIQNMLVEAKNERDLWRARALTTVFGWEQDKLCETRMKDEIDRLQNVIRDYLDWADPVLCTAPDLKIIRSQMKLLVSKQ